MSLFFQVWNKNLFVLLGQTVVINNILLLGGIVVQNFAASMYGYMSDVLKKNPESLCTYKYFLLMTDDGKSN